jgi:NodT family efflux transporter outer membrane factor (OMF) lipoprotein
MIRHSLLIAAAAAALAGCTVGPDYAPPSTAAPPTFREASNTADADERWWASFGDPTLTALVERALASSLDLEVADARIRQARSALEAALGGALPQVIGSESIQRQRLSENGVQLNNIPAELITPELEFTVYRAAADASWELDLFGRNRRSVEAAAARAEAAVEGRRDAAIRVAAEVARIYSELRTAERRAEIARASAVSSRRTLALVSQQVRVGEEAAIEERRAASELREAEAAIPPLESEARSARYALDLLLGSPPGTAAELISDRPAGTLAVPQIPSGLPSDLLLRRPDLRRAERALGAATADVGIATADLYPRFSLIGTLGLEALDPGDFLKSASTFWVVGPSISLPIFDGGRRRAELRRQQAELDEALASYRNTVLTALVDVERALIALSRERGRGDLLRRARMEQVDLLALTRRRYEVGEVALTDVLDSERRVARLDDLIAQSDATVIGNAITLEKALGGGWRTADAIRSVSAGVEESRTND